MLVTEKNIKNKVFAAVASGVLMLSLYFTLHNYFLNLDSKEQDQLDELRAITNTLALSVKGDDLMFLFTKYKNKDDITDNGQDSLYLKTNKLLASAYKINSLNSDIYTLSYEALGDTFYFGVNSSDKPYFRHKYNSFPKILKENYEIGGTIPSYQDDHGTWISAFAPVKNTLGQTVAVLQTDKKLADFKKEANEGLLRDILISLFGTGLTMYLLFVFLKKVFVQDEKNRAEIARQNLLIQEKNEKITNSINYAKRIQEAIMAQNEHTLACLSDSFQISLPKDIVSGDFLWYRRVEEGDCGSLVIASADCTGHGVPGALMSMLGVSALNEVVLEKKILSPDLMLASLDEYIMNMLHQDQAEEGKTSRRDGMDMAVCVVNFKDMTIQFSGAHNPVLLFRKGESAPKFIKGSKLSLGGDTEKKQKTFEKHSFGIQKGDRVYLFSDGLQDQFGRKDAGGPPEKFMRKRLIQLLADTQNIPNLKEQKEAVLSVFRQWRGEEKQIDDVSMFAFEI